MKIKSLCYNFIFIFSVVYHSTAQNECALIPLPNHYAQTKNISY